MKFWEIMFAIMINISIIIVQTGKQIKDIKMINLYIIVVVKKYIASTNHIYSFIFIKL